MERRTGEAMRTERQWVRWRYILYVLYVHRYMHTYVHTYIHTYVLCVMMFWYILLLFELQWFGVHSHAHAHTYTCVHRRACSCPVLL